MRLIRRLSGRKAFSPHPPFWAQQENQILHTGGAVSSNKEWLDHSFLEYVQKVYKDNGVTYSCIQTRMWAFAETSFVFKHNKTDDYDKDSPRLQLLKNPWPGGEIGDLLTMMEVDASLAGNAYVTHVDDKGNYGKAARGRVSSRLVRMRPNFVQIVIYSPSGNPWALDAKIAGYLYKPYLAERNDQTILLMPDEVAHYKPVPDPEARFRGMSWITPVIREIKGDKAAMSHKLAFYEKGATLNYVISLNENVSKEDFDEFVMRFKANHQGADNAYKTLFLGGGADVTPVSADLKQLDFTKTQGHGETRIAAASGVPPVIVGLSEGLQAATYSNYAQARRRFADITMRPLWRMAAASLAKLVDVPHNHKLWYDDRDIPFLRDDKKEEAEIVEITGRAAKSLVDAGWEPESVKKYLVTRDPADLKHSGMVSVQLLPPGTVHPMVDPNAQGGKPSGGGQQKPKPAGDKPKPRKE